MFKKSQSAIEFLTTWGWALLMILLIIVALGYLGLFSAWSYLPDECYLPAGIQCVAYKATHSGVTIVLKNKMGYKINDVSVKVQNCGEGTGPQEIENGQIGTYNATCDIETHNFKGWFNISYILTETELEHTAKGHIRLRVE
jgi:hypothetical protein